MPGDQEQRRRDKVRAALDRQQGPYTPNGFVIRSGVQRAQPSNMKFMQRNTRKPFPKAPRPASPPTSMLITGGIGDFLAIDAHLTPDERFRAKRVVLATRAHAGISDLISANPEWKHASVHVAGFDWAKKFCFLDREEAFRETKDPLVRDADDFSINRVFGEIQGKRRPYQYSSFCVHPMGDPPLSPAGRHVTLCPESENSYGNSRSFDDRDWQHVLAWLGRCGQRGVVVGLGKVRVPDHPLLVDLTGRTSMPEAIETLKRSSGYAGIDSSLSVLAAKLFQYPDLVVKSNNGHLLGNKEVYYAPQTAYQFVVGDMSVLGKFG